MQSRRVPTSLSRFVRTDAVSRKSQYRADLATYRESSQDSHGVTATHTQVSKRETTRSQNVPTREFRPIDTVVGKRLDAALLDAHAPALSVPPPVPPKRRFERGDWTSKVGGQRAASRKDSRRPPKKTTLSFLETHRLKNWRLSLSLSRRRARAPRVSLVLNTKKRARGQARRDRGNAHAPVARHKPSAQFFCGKLERHSASCGLFLFLFLFLFFERASLSLSLVCVYSRASSRRPRVPWIRARWTRSACRTCAARCSTGRPVTWPCVFRTSPRISSYAAASSERVLRLSLSLSLSQDDDDDAYERGSSAPLSLSLFGRDAPLGGCMSGGEVSRASQRVHAVSSSCVSHLCQAAARRCSLESAQSCAKALSLSLSRQERVSRLRLPGGTRARETEMTKRARDRNDEYSRIMSLFPKRPLSLSLSLSSLANASTLSVRLRKDMGRTGHLGLETEQTSARAWRGGRPPRAASTHSID